MQDCGRYTTMMNIQLDDGRQRVYQWEIGRYIKLIGFSSCDKVFFSNPDSDEAYVVETQTSDNVIKAQIPNELLQLDKKIKVYCNGVDANGQYVQFHTIIPLEARQKPASYVYEPTEIMTFESVLEEAEKLKNETQELKNETDELKNETDELKNEADGFSKIAERYAKGTEDGVPVTSGDGFQDNAKYFKEQAEKALAEGLEAYNTNADEKTKAYNDNALKKTADFDSNAVQKTTDFNDNAANEKNAFNSNAEDKTSAFDEHVSSKQNDFDSHVSSKENELESVLDSHTNEKKTVLNEYTSETLKNQLDEYTIQKKSDIDSHASEKVTEYDENADEKTNAFNMNADSKGNSLAQALDEYVAELKSSELVPLVDNATQNADNAAASAELAEKFASNPEDTVVKDDKYSALHYAKKAEKAAADAESTVGQKLTPGRVLVSNADGKFTVSDITTTILNYLAGLTGNVQTQLDKTIFGTSSYAVL